MLLIYSAGAIADANTPDRHRVMLRWIDELGPNVAARLLWLNMLIVTEARRAADCDCTTRLHAVCSI
jgi:hypothetical protein